MAVSVSTRLVRNDLLTLRGQLRARASQVVRATATDVQAGAMRRSRVDTGAMKNAWRVEQRGELSAVVANGVEHVIYNEYGTVHLPAQPMATPAAEEARPGFEAAMRSLLG